MGRIERLVLIVDDGPEDREAVRRLLSKDEGIEYRFLECPSGGQGLQACRASGPDCLLLDAELPDMDGLEFLERLGPSPGDRPIPVVLFADGEAGTIAARARERGVEDCLIKGRYSPEYLRKTVGDAIGRASLRRECDRLRDELARHEELALEADRLKDEFLATLAHELRNPLAPILNAVQIMKLRADDRPTVDRMREMIDQQLRQLCRLVDDLLDVSRISRGKIQLQTWKVDLVPIVNLAVEDARPAIERRRQELTVRLLPGPLRLEADPSRIEQILSNLLSNASKYTDPGGSIALTVDRQGDEISVSVADNGIGIAPELLPRVFDLYAPAGRRVDHPQGGLGLGLSLVRSLTRMHGGQVEARSAGPGHGSEFIVRLQAAHEPAGPDPAEFEVDAGADSPRRSVRVLIVDDNVHAAESLAIVVKLWNHEARVAFAGPEAIGMTEVYRPHVILLDIGLPGMDGYAVARALRARPDFDDVRLVAMTGYGRDEDFRRSLEAGFDRHLVKPIDFAVLEEILDQVAGSEPG